MFDAGSCRNGVADLRAERNSNPVCQTNCFANYAGDFTTLPSYQAGGVNALDVPYSQDIKYNQHQAFQGVDPVVWSPRVAFSWAPGAINHFPCFPGGGKTVISGGFGIFYDPQQGFCRLIQMAACDLERGSEGVRHYQELQ